MSSVIVALIIVGSISFICFVLIAIHNKHRRDAINLLLKQFSAAGEKHALSFSSQEILKNAVVGLDGQNRKLLVVTKEEDHGSFIVNLDEVRSLQVKKLYASAVPGAGQHLEKIVLQFEFDNKPTASIVFYDHVLNHIYEAAELEQKAKHWELFLSKMQTPRKHIA